MNTLTSSMVRGLKGAPASILLLLMCTRQPVRNAWLAANSGYTDKPIAAGLVYLKELGLIVAVLGGWRLAGNAEQLPLATIPEDDPAPLQAGVPLDDPDAALREGVGIIPTGSLIIIMKDSDKESFNNNNNGAPSRNNSDSLTERHRGRSRHVADVAAALLRKGAPLPIDDDPLPPDLRAAAARLVERTHLPRDRAEMVVARSPWPAPKILEQVDIWLAYRSAPAGANLDEQFPWLVAARIEAGEECPFDTRDAGATSRYDGYLPFVDPEQEP